MINVFLVVKVFFQINVNFFHGVAKQNESFFSHIDDVFKGVGWISVFGAVLKNFFSWAFQEDNFSWVDILIVWLFFKLAFAAEVFALINFFSEVALIAELFLFLLERWHFFFDCGDNC